MIKNNIAKLTNLDHLLFPPSVVHNFHNKIPILKGDSGATNHYVAPNDVSLLTNVRNNSSINVSLPNGSILESTKTGTLPFANLSSTATEAHILPGLSNTSLLSLGQLADDGCIILLTKTHLKVLKNFETILTGFRNKQDGLWDVPFPSTTLQSSIQQPTQVANIITPQNNPIKTLVQYLHAALFSPAKSTLLKAIKNNHFIGWPGLNVKNVEKYLLETPATAKGHLDQHRSNLQSTNIKSTSMPILESDTFPEQESNRSHLAMATIISHSKNSKAYFDLTGQFPYVSARGAKYILVLYDYDSNGILVHTLKTRNAGEIRKAWISLHTRLQSKGSNPTTYIMDNEAAAELKHAIVKYKLKYQLTPPHMHRINAAERAIRTFKNHFLAGLASVDPTFPVNEWDRLIDQAEITLNLLRTSRINPKLSAYAALNGNFDFNRTPMAPPGTKVVVHVKPKLRASWGYHGEDGFYTGPALEHYRCIQCLMTDTRRIRIADTVQFFPHNVDFPKITMNDRLINALDEIVSTLASPTFRAHNPSLVTWDEGTMLAIKIIANMLHRVTPKPPLPPPQPVLLPQQVMSTLPTKKIYHAPKLPRVIPKSKRHPHSILLRRANQQPSVTPIATSILKRLLHIYNKTTGKKETLRSLLNNTETKAIWSQASSNEYGRLMKGNATGIHGTDTMEPVPLASIPKTNAITYGSMVCDHRPLKTEKYRCRLVVGGDRLTYEHETAAPAANLLETKLILNSTISTPNARFFTVDIKDFFLSSDMPAPEYMKMHKDEIPEDIFTKYDMKKLTDNKNCVNFKIKKGMYGLKQAAILAFNQLEENLAPHGYRPIPNTVGMWRHESRPIQFCLCVDDFGIKYVNKDDADHLVSALKSHYNITIDWTGRNYCGLTLTWNYQDRHVDISMPGYIEKLLHRLKHTKPRQPVHAPHVWSKPVFGRHIQQGTPSDASPFLSSSDKKLVQSVVGALLYYTRAVDPSMYPALNEVSITQSAPTAATLKKCHTLLDYVSWHPNAIIRYHASDMILNIDSDAAYLVLPRARSRLAGHFFLSSAPTPIRTVLPNGPILTECKTIQHVVSSAAEAETAALFHNAQTARPIRHILIELGHEQPPTPIKTDNATANAFIHQTMRHRKSKSWDMRYWWLKENIAQSEFHIFWDKGVHNWADYFTKHFAPSIHQVLRQRYVHRTNLICTAIRHTLHRSLSARV